jgi:hypothetical protein
MKSLIFACILIVILSSSVFSTEYYTEYIGKYNHNGHIGYFNDEQFSIFLPSEIICIPSDICNGRENCDSDLLKLEIIHENNTREELIISEKDSKLCSSIILPPGIYILNVTLGNFNVNSNINTIVIPDLKIDHSSDTIINSDGTVVLKNHKRIVNNDKYKLVNITFPGRDTVNIDCPLIGRQISGSDNSNMDCFNDTSCDYSINLDPFDVSTTIIETRTYECSDMFFHESDVRGMDSDMVFFSNELKSDTIRDMSQSFSIESSIYFLGLKKIHIGYVTPDHTLKIENGYNTYTWDRAQLEKLNLKKLNLHIDYYYVWDLDKIYMLIVSTLLIPYLISKRKKIIGYYNKFIKKTS